ncbi:MAG: molybdenum cofactor biosynthesis enzyme, partial [Eggerthellaceae bacterium]|nr:molybdenum cofactor biosynthesis enzyme [Eggerthellaceae bacterium]
MVVRLNRQTRNAGRDLFRDESGFTTTGMVLSLLITLALVFTAAQVYRINSASAEVQDVADAAALAAENQVAEYMIVARFCDAVVLSLSLTGLVVTGLGLAAMCTPATATVSEALIEAGKNLIRQRDAFAERSAYVLNKYQEALPFLAAAAAAGVCVANDGD